ncbi:MAG: VOC family protein [Pirellulaceae bacterium]
MTNVQPYLFFSGRCEEAIEFYKSTIGAEVTMLMRFSDSPDQPPEGMLEAGFENKVMHASLSIGGSPIMASDGCDSNESFKGFRIALTLPTEAETKRAFSALAEGGQVDMPLDKTFWSPCFGMLTDKFGLGWMVSVIDGPEG